MFKVKFEVLLEEPQTFTLLCQNEPQISVDTLFYVEHWVVDLGDVLLDLSEGVYSTVELEGFPPR